MIEQEFKDSKWHKTFVFVVCLGLLVLVLIYLFPSDYIESTIDSYKIKDGIVVLRSGEVINMSIVYSDLVKFYLSDRTTETKICLTGNISDSHYVVDNFYVPKIVHKSFSNVISEECNSSTIISMHTHPFRRCIFSSVDIDSAKDKMIGVMCEVDRFNFFI